MKIVILLSLLCTTVLVSAETADQVARRVIPSFSGFDNAIEGTPEARIRATIHNAEFTLEQHMLSDAVSNEVRLMFALRVLRERIDRACVLKSLESLEVDEEKTKELKDKLELDRIVIAKGLQEIRKQNKPNKSLHPTASSCRAKFRYCSKELKL